ncbi:CarD family transcriptional regulator [Ferdinandcohnia sp. Marseille-Q9671]
MFSIGDLVIYSNMGICRIDDICEKTYSGTTRSYYVIHPIEDSTLTIHNPVDNDRIRMQGIINRSEAEEILESFRLPGIQWIENGTDRNKVYSERVANGSRMEIAGIINTLMCKKYEFEIIDKKVSEHDRRILLYVQKILFKELAISLDKSVDAISKEINRMISYKMSKSSPHEVANIVN